VIVIARQLLSDPLRTLLTIAAMAAVVAFILILEGFNAGLLAQMRNTVMGRQGDLIFSQAGIFNMIAARSILSEYVRADIEKVPGVTEAHP